VLGRRKYLLQEALSVIDLSQIRKLSITGFTASVKFGEMTLGTYRKRDGKNAYKPLVLTTFELIYKKK
jgi:hypothetical protein